jgi:hypothetical protein
MNEELVKSNESFAVKLEAAQIDKYVLGYE